MRNTVTLLEKILKEKLMSKDYTVRVHSTKSGNLPNRAPFIRNVYRQTSLNEFVDNGLGEMKLTNHVKDIVYTVHARFLKEDKISELYDLIIEDLNQFVYKNR